MMCNGLVSIILPVHNGARYLAESIESCLQQDYANLELVIVDDGSTDQTPAIIQGYEMQDRRVRSVRRHVNGGLPTALNSGFENAKGELLTWTSDDNYYAPDAIRELANVLATCPEVDLVYSDFYLIDSNGQVTQRVQVEPPENLIYHNCMGASFLYRRCVYETLGKYNPDFALSEDYEFWVRAYKQFKLMRLQKPLYYYRQHPESLAGKNDIFKRTKVVHRVQLAHFAEDTTLSSQLRAQIYLQASFDAYLDHQYDQAPEYIHKAMLLDKDLDRQPKKFGLALQNYSDAIFGGMGWSRACACEFGEVVVNKMPAHVHISPVARGAMLAPLYTAAGFESFAKGNLLDARNLMLKAIRYAPANLLNRGVVAVLVRSIFGKSHKPAQPAKRIHSE